MPLWKLFKTFLLLLPQKKMAGFSILLSICLIRFVDVIFKQAGPGNFSGKFPGPSNLFNPL